MSPTSYLAAPPRVAPRLCLRAKGRQSTKLGIDPGHAATAATRGGLGVSVVRPSVTSDYARSATRLTRTLFAAQSLSSAATVAIFPIVAIAGAKLSGQSTWAGVPAMAYQLGGAFVAFFLGRLVDPLGRRSGLAIGIVLGAHGSTDSAGGILGQSFWT